MADSYETRIRLAEEELVAARRARDFHYPGSPEWEDANARVDEWERTLVDLRRAQAS